MWTHKRTKAAIVTLVTGGNLCLGLTAIILASKGFGLTAVFCLFLSMCLDALDGQLARRWEVFSDFGAELDSLADLTSFVVANAVLLFFWFQGQVWLGFQILAGVLFTLCGACRLARFNVTPTTGVLFQGMPTTGVAILIAAIYVSHPNLDPAVGLLWQAVLGLLMVSSLAYPKATSVLRLPKPLFLVIAVAGLFDFQRTTAVCCLAYVFAGPVLSALQRARAPLPSELSEISIEESSPDSAEHP